MSKVAIIGTGLSASIIAAKLSEHGYNITVFDKARGVGGRLANRWHGDRFFEHGCFHFDLKQSMLEKYNLTELNKIIEPWAAVVNDQKQKRKYDQELFRINPKMNHLVKYFLVNCNVQLSTRVEKINYDGQVISLYCKDKKLGDFDYIFSTIPSAQILELLIPFNDCLKQSINAIEMQGLWVSMLSSVKSSNYDDIYYFRDFILDKAIKNSGHDNADLDYWVFHFKEEWSNENIDIDREAVDKILIDSVSELEFLSLENIRYLSSHRWRYAYRKGNDPIGQIKSDCMPLFLAGDWTWGFGLEAAVHSAFRALDESQLIPA